MEQMCLFFFTTIFCHSYEVLSIRKDI